MCKFESPQSQESRAQSANSSKAYRKPRALILSDSPQGDIFLACNRRKTKVHFCRNSSFIEENQNTIAGNLQQAGDTTTTKSEFATKLLF